jgi:membrane-associated protease RseP (regulator of RpoE activity)
MGDSSSSLSAPRGPAEPPFGPPFSPDDFEPPPLPRPLRRPRWLLFLVLLALTFISMTAVAGLSPDGVLAVAGALLGLLQAPDGLLRALLSADWTNALWYSIPCLAILSAHEFGHYLTARHYGIDTSLPYYLPMPIFVTGTMGAFIRIRQPIFRKRELFDIGIAGPIAGFLVALPIVFVGVYWSEVVPRAEILRGNGLEYGDPLLIKLAIWLTFGSTTDNQILAIHPLGFAGWFGLIVTSLNLFPFGQLDGGHISYSVFGHRSTLVSQVTAGVLILLAAFVSWSWVAWAAIMVVMLLVLGPKHPAVFDEDVPLDRTRLWLAAFAVVMFILCFTPTPITVTGR